MLASKGPHPWSHPTPAAVSRQESTGKIRSAVPGHAYLPCTSGPFGKGPHSACPYMGIYGRRKTVMKSGLPSKAGGQCPSAFVYAAVNCCACKTRRRTAHTHLRAMHNRMHDNGAGAGAAVVVWHTRGRHSLGTRGGAHGAWRSAPKCVSGWSGVCARVQARGAASS